MNRTFRCFHGATSSTSARIYVEMPVDYPVAKVTVAGPFSERHATLPTAVPCRTAGPGPTQLWTTQLVDPCFWSPRSAVWYEVTVEQKGGDVATAPLGIRMFGARGRNLMWDGRRYVLRAVGYDGPVTTVNRDVWESLRETNTALFVSQPSKELISGALRAGVPLIDDQRDLQDDAEPQAERWEGHPALVMQLTASPQIGARRRLACNMLIARTIDRWPPPDGETPDVWVMTIPKIRSGEITELDRRMVAVAAAESHIPVAVMQHGQSASEPTKLRSLCDRLQAELAPTTALGGYFVTCGTPR